MAQVRHHDHKGKKFVITVNRNGPRFEATVDIPGMHLREAERQLEADTREGAFRSAKQRAEDLLDNPPVAVAPTPAIEY